MAVGVSNGLFVVTLDPGAGIFDGTARWLEISVSTNGWYFRDPKSAPSDDAHAIRDLLG